MTNNIAHGEIMGQSHNTHSEAEGVEQFRLIVARLQRAINFAVTVPAILAGLYCWSPLATFACLEASKDLELDSNSFTINVCRRIFSK